MNGLADRLSHRVQISADALAAYVDAIDRAFGPDADFGQIVKWCEADEPWTMGHLLDATL